MYTHQCHVRTLNKKWFLIKISACCVIWEDFRNLINASYAPSYLNVLVDYITGIRPALDKKEI